MEEKNVQHNNVSITYTLKKYRRSRSLRVRVKSTGEVLVTAPIYVKEDMVTSFIRAHAPWILSKLTYMKQFTHIPIEGSKLKHYTEHKEKARELLTERVAFFNKHYKYTYNRISIKNTSTRWGSCSSQKNLNFSYKLVFVPQELLDYVVVHELCHLTQMNHGPHFWNLVAEVFPHYKKLRTELKKYKL